MGWREPGGGRSDSDSVRSDNCLRLVLFYASYLLRLYNFRYVRVLSDRGTWNRCPLRQQICIIEYLSVIFLWYMYNPYVLWTMSMLRPE